jgi:hypothetical protein
MRTLLWNCRGAATDPDWKDVILGAGEPELLMIVSEDALFAICGDAYDRAFAWSGDAKKLSSNDSF